MRQIHTIFICNDGDYFLRHRRRVADTMAQSDVEVQVIAGGPPLAVDRIGRWRYINVKIERFSMNARADAALAITSFREMTRSRARSVQLITLKPVVVGGLAAIFARAIGRGPARIILTIPGLGRLMSPGSLELGFRARATRKVVGQIVRFLSARRDVFVTFETETDRQHWIRNRLVKTDRAVLIGGAGVDPTRFHPPVEPRAGRRLRVLFASRLLGAKGVDAFVQAARALKGPKIEFVLAGMVEPGDPDSVAPETLAQDESITFLGEVTDMPELLRSVDLVCLPTRYGEGIPRILIEAAATGLPCIATNLDGCMQIVRDGVNGVVIPVGSPDEMASTLGTAIEAYEADRQLLKRHGENSLAIFRSGDFTEETVVRRFIGLLAPNLAADENP